MPAERLTLASAASTAEVLEAVARFTWWEGHRAECPDVQLPTEDDLCKWHEACPAAAVDAANDALECLYIERSAAAGLGPGVYAPEWTVFRRPTRDAGLALVAHWIGEGGAHVAVGVEGVHRDWLAVDRDYRPVHPLDPLVAAWQARPAPVRANVRMDRPRIIPAQLAMFDAPRDDSRGRLFRAPVAARGESQLPLFEAGTPGGRYITPSLPLALYDLGVNVDSPGPGVSLALRMFVEAILAAPLYGRRAGQPMALEEVSVRYMLDRCYPTRRPKPNEWMPAIERARAALAKEDAAIVWADGVARSAVLFTSFPRSLDDAVQIIVNLPPGSEHGPQVSDRLHLYGPRRGRHYRALLNLAYWWHEPGRTLFPARRGGGAHWLRTENPRRYRTLTDAELVHLVFPVSTRSERRKLVHEAHRVIADLRDDGELRIVDGKVLPPAMPKVREEG